MPSPSSLLIRRSSRWMAKESVKTGSPGECYGHAKGEGKNWKDDDFLVPFQSLPRDPHQRLCISYLAHGSFTSFRQVAPDSGMHCIAAAEGMNPAGLRSSSLWKPLSGLLYQLVRLAHQYEWRPEKRMIIPFFADYRASFLQRIKFAVSFFDEFEKLFHESD